MTKIDQVVNNDDQVATVADKSKSDFSQSLEGCLAHQPPESTNRSMICHHAGLKLSILHQCLKLISCPGKNLCWSIRTKSNQMENTQRPWFARLFPGSQVNQQ